MVKAKWLIFKHFHALSFCFTLFKWNTLSIITPNTTCGELCLLFLTAVKNSTRSDTILLQDFRPTFQQ